MGILSRGAAKEAFAYNHNKSIMGTVRAASVFAAIQGGSEKMRDRILTAAIYIVVLEVVAHSDPIRCDARAAWSRDCNAREDWATRVLSQ